MGDLTQNRASRAGILIKKYGRYTQIPDSALQSLPLLDARLTARHRRHKSRHRQPISTCQIAVPVMGGNQVFRGLGQRRIDAANLPVQLIELAHNTLGIRRVQAGSGRVSLGKSITHDLRGRLHIRHRMPYMRVYLAVHMFAEHRLRQQIHLPPMLARRPPQEPVLATRRNLLQSARRNRNDRASQVVFGDFPAAIGANHKPPRICLNGYIRMSRG